VDHQRVTDLLLDIVRGESMVCVSEMSGAVGGIDPETGHYVDDTKRYIDNNTKLSQEEKQLIFEGNTRRVFSRLKI